MHVTNLVVFGGEDAKLREIAHSNKYRITFVVLKNKMKVGACQIS